MMGSASSTGFSSTASGSSRIEVGRGRPCRRTGGPDCGWTTARLLSARVGDRTNKNAPAGAGGSMEFGVIKEIGTAFLIGSIALLTFEGFLYFSSGWTMTGFFRLPLGIDPPEDKGKKV